MAAEEGPTTTGDGHLVIVSGRRRRATDPAIPAGLRRALMAARRDVGAALRAGQDPAHARARVQTAEAVLGERGTPRWDQSFEQRRQRWEAGTPATPGPR